MITPEEQVFIDGQIERLKLPDLRGTPEMVAKAMRARSAFVHATEEVLLPSKNRRNAYRRLFKIELAPMWLSMVVEPFQFFGKGYHVLTDADIRWIYEIVLAEKFVPFSVLCQEPLFVGLGLPYRLGESLSSQKKELFIKHLGKLVARNQVCPTLSPERLENYRVARELWQRERRLHSIQGLEPPFYDPNKHTTREHIGRLEYAFFQEDYPIPAALQQNNRLAEVKSRGLTLVRQDLV